MTGDRGSHRGRGGGSRGPGVDEDGPAPPGGTPLLTVAWKVVAGFAVLGALILGVGAVLPGTWDARRTIRIDAPPDSVYRWIGRLEAWERWTVWGGVEVTASGPEEGAGATRSWDDPYLGDGTLTVLQAEPPHLMRYRVEVQGGSMVTEGSLGLSADRRPGETLVTWEEHGDFGWNPMMGYAALTMGRIQGVELERSLRRLRSLVETGILPDSLAPAPAPGDEPEGGSGPAR